MKLTFTPDERATLCRRLGVSPSVSDAELAATFAAEMDVDSIPDRAERIKAKQARIKAAEEQRRRSRPYNDANDRVVELDPTGSYPTAWLEPAAALERQPGEGRISYGGNRNRVTWSP
jgi:hypothetical protein